MSAGTDQFGSAGAGGESPEKAMPRDPSPGKAMLPAAVILAAGKGKRMGSDLPKVLHPVGGRPMVCAVIDACREVGCDPVVLVVGHGQELVREAVAAAGQEVVYAVQDRQLGTGHAVACAREALAGRLEGGPEEAGADVFVLAGDGPLIRAETLRTLLERHRSPIGSGSRSTPAATLATSVIEDPTGYGRIVRDEGGRFQAIVEHSSATAEQLAIREVNPSYYCFDGRALFAALERVEPNAESGEYYVTDVPGLLLQEGRGVEVIAAVPPEDVLSINTPQHLAEVDRLYRARRSGELAGGAEAGR